MREVISIHVGQAGVQIGNACCECGSHAATLLITGMRREHDKTRRLLLNMKLVPSMMLLY